MVRQSPNFIDTKPNAEGQKSFCAGAETGFLDVLWKTRCISTGRYVQKAL